MKVLLLIIAIVICVSSGKLVKLPVLNDDDHWDGYVTVDMDDDYQHEHVDDDNYLSMIETAAKNTPNSFKQAVLAELDKGRNGGFVRETALSLPRCPEERSGRKCNGWVRGSPFEAPAGEFGPHCGCPVSILNDMSLVTDGHCVITHDPCTLKGKGTWSITTEGAFNAGEWHDGMEICSKHIYISNKADVIAAGEYKVEGNTITFSINSGSYMHGVLKKGHELIHNTKSHRTYSVKSPLQRVFKAAKCSGKKLQLDKAGSYSFTTGRADKRPKWKDTARTYFTEEGSKTPTHSMSIVCKNKPKIVSWGQMKKYCPKLDRNGRKSDSGEHRWWTEKIPFNTSPWKVQNTEQTNSATGDRLYLGASLCTCASCYAKTGKDAARSCTAGKKTRGQKRAGQKKKTLQPKKQKKTQAKKTQQKKKPAKKTQQKKKPAKKTQQKKAQAKKTQQKKKQQKKKKNKNL